MKAIINHDYKMLINKYYKFFIFLLATSLLIQNTHSQESSEHVITGVEIGQKAPELKFKSTDGEIIALSSLKGKMVLIDFWASWCRPCRFENPNVVNAYHTFKDKQFKNGEGFTVYSVSLDQNKTRWENAIAADQLSWEYHVSDLAGWRSRAAALYGVRGIPASFLIDGDGIIVAKGKSLRGQGLTNTLNAHLQVDKVYSNDKKPRLKK